MNKSIPLINHPSAWKSSDFSSPDDYAFDLKPRHLRAIAKALKTVQQQGKELADILPGDFELPKLATELAQIRHELVDGQGLVLMRGLPVDNYSVDELAIIYWGLGTHWGRGLSQCHYGDRIGFVTHNPDRGENWRGYQSQKGQNFHTDADDIVGLFCIRPAKEGGLSRLISEPAIYNEIANTRPDLLEPLAEGFYFHWFGERPPNADATSSYKIPVLSWAEDTLSVCYLRGYMTKAAQERGVDFPPKLNEALDLFETIWEREDLVLEFPLNPGEAVFMNNYTVLHARTGFEDWPDPNQRRLLLRLWLEIEPPRPLHPNLRRYYDDLKVAYRPSKSGQPIP